MAISTTLYRAAAIMLVGVIAAGADSLRRPIRLPDRTKLQAPIATPPAVANPAAPTSTSTPNPPPAAAAMPQKGDISIAQARELFTKKAAFADARSRKDYEAKHVDGAWHLPVEAFLGGASPDAVQFMNRSEPVVVYCTGGDCHASHDVVIMLEAIGFTRCYVMVDGLPGWEAAGYETASGPGPAEGGQ